jgi:hypothetical protein
MTIPDIGHCAGSGSPPVDGSEREETVRSPASAPLARGRFELHETGVISLHDAAHVDDREPWPQSSSSGAILDNEPE